MRFQFVLGMLASVTMGCVDAPTTNEVGDEIIGGVTDNGDPAVVAVFAHAPGATSGALCTGTVIAPTKVLTAAHCLSPASVGSGMVFDVLQGTTISLSNNLGPVASVAYHEQWDVNNITGGYDVGVVTLANATAIAPSRYNTAAYTSAMQALPVRIVGYGLSSHTNTSTAGTKRTATTTVRSFDSLHLQIGNNSKENCHGDSGGPAFQTLNGVETIVGITSYGSDLGTLYLCLGGGYDTRVDDYAAWIASH